MSEEKAEYNAKENGEQIIVGTCRHCKITTPWMLARTIASNGTSLVYWICAKCGKRAELNRNIPHDMLDEQGVKLKNINVINDFSETHECARCGNNNTEYHHWAPRYLFNDAEYWPGDYLCKDCHSLWHAVVTPDMCKTP